MTDESTNGKERINTFLETNEDQTLETKKTNISLEENTKEISDNTHIKSYGDTNSGINSGINNGINNDNAPTIISKQSIYKSDNPNCDDKVGSIEDKIIKSYLSKQANSFGINISEKNESFNAVDSSSSDTDSTPLLDIFKKEELQKKRKSSKLSLGKKEEIKRSKQICDSEMSENGKAGNKDKNNKFDIALNSSKNKECDNDNNNNNCAKEQSENVISSDDELLINIIKDEQDKNAKSSKIKFNRNKKEEEDASSCDTSDYDSDAVLIVKSSFDPRNRSSKEKLVAQLLTRWWYVLPDWPIPNYDYTNELENKKLKLVSIEEFEDHEDIDKHGFKKVYEISAFPGVFRDSLGTAYDLRDKETCPCYNNFIKKTDLELLQLICTAIKNQMICLKNSVYNETYKEVILEKELKEAESKLRRVMDKNNKIVE